MNGCAPTYSTPKILEVRWYGARILLDQCDKAADRAREPWICRSRESTPEELAYGYINWYILGLEYKVFSCCFSSWYEKKEKILLILSVLIVITLFFVAFMCYLLFIELVFHFKHAVLRGTKNDFRAGRTRTLQRDTSCPVLKLFLGFHTQQHVHQKQCITKPSGSFTAESLFSLYSAHVAFVWLTVWFHGV